MIHLRRQQIGYALALSDGAVLAVAFLLAFWLRNAVGVFGISPERPVLSSHVWILLLALPMYWVLASYQGLYQRIRATPAGKLVWRTVVVFALLAMTLGSATFLFQAWSASRAVFLLFLGISFAVISAKRIVIKQLLHHRLGQKNGQTNVLIVGTNADAFATGQRMTNAPDVMFDLLGYVRVDPDQPDAPPASRVLGDLEDLPAIVEGRVVDEVVFVVPLAELERCSPAIRWLEEAGVSVHLKIDFVKTLFGRTFPTNWDGVPMLSIAPTPQDALSLLVKRTMDLVIAGGALVALAPVFAGVALGIKATSRGPVLFVQERVGLNGRRFRFYKFRSMYTDAEKRRAELAEHNIMTGPVFKMRDDPRITPLGRWLRKFSIDELPQLWNVFRGEMSLVGPRPPVPGEVEEYERWQRRRLSMKPGLTCLWQVKGRNQIPFDQWMKLDLAYIDNWSLKLDVAILLRTIPAVLSTRGAH